MLAALSVSMGSMVVGYSSSYTSPGLVSMQDNSTTTFEVTKEIVSRNNTALHAKNVFEIVFKQTCLARTWRNRVYSGEITRNNDAICGIPFLSQHRAKAGRSVLRHVCFRMLRPDCCSSRFVERAVKCDCAKFPANFCLFRFFANLAWLGRRTTILKR